MRFTQTWADSLKVFIPKNGKTFLLITLNSIIQTYKTLIKNFWWLFVGYFALDIGATYWLAQYDLLLLRVGSQLLDIGFLLLTFIVFLAARAALEAKDVRHSIKYFKHFLFFLLYTYLFTLLAGSRFYLEIDPATDTVSIISAYFSWLEAVVLMSPFVVMSPLFVFIVAFTLDSRITLTNFFKNMWQAVKMCFYNYPVCLFLFIVIFYAGVGFDRFFFFLFEWLQLSIMGITQDGQIIVMPAFNILKYAQLIFLPIPICVLINVYIQKVHEQFELYFPVKG